MNDLDLGAVATHADLVACLEQLYIRADSPSYRDLEKLTDRPSGTLPGSGLRRVRLGRSAIGEMLRGLTFPKKAFLLTFVDACGVDIAADRQWAEAWDRLAGQYAKRAGQAQAELAGWPPEVSQLHQEMTRWKQAAALAQAESSELRAEAERLRAELTDAQDEVARLRKRASKRQIRAADDEGDGPSVNEVPSGAAQIHIVFVGLRP